MLIRRKLRLAAALASGLTASLFVIAQPASAQETVNVYGEPVHAMRYGSASPTSI